MNLETKITIYKFTPQVFTLTRFLFILSPATSDIRFLWGQRNNLRDFIFKQGHLLNITKLAN